MKVKTLASKDIRKFWDLNFITDHLVIFILGEESLNGKKFIKSLKGVYYDRDASINSVFPSDVN